MKEIECGPAAGVHEELNSMDLNQIVDYAMDHPDNHYELVTFIGRNYNEAKKHALLETAAIRGVLREPLFEALQKDVLPQSDELYP